MKTKPKGYPNLYNSIMMVNLIIIDLNEKNYEEALKKIKEYYY